MPWSVLIPAEEIKNRISMLQQTMKAHDIDAALIVQRVDILYLAGTAQNAFLYVPANGEPLLMVKKYWPRARQESSITHIVQLASIKRIPDTVIRHKGSLPRIVGLEMDVLPHREFEFFRRLFGERQIVDLSPLLHQIRSTKSDWELMQLKSTAEKSAQCFEFAVDKAVPGKSCVELASSVLIYARKLGHGARLRSRHHREKALPFEIRVLSSSHDASPVIGKDCVVEMDFKWMLNGYHIHETRLLMLGNPPEELVNACHGVGGIHDLIIQRAVPGKPANQVYREIKEIVKRGGYGVSLFGSDARGRPWASGPLGHGIGMELREPPYIDEQDQTVLSPNMTLAIRPVLSVSSRLCVSMGSVIRIGENENELISKVPAKIFSKTH